MTAKRRLSPCPRWRRHEVSNWKQSPPRLPLADGCCGSAFSVRTSPGPIHHLPHGGDGPERGRAQLEADLAYRNRLCAGRRVAQMLATLHPAIPRLYMEEVEPRRRREGGPVHRRRPRTVGSAGHQRPHLYACLEHPERGLLQDQVGSEVGKRRRGISLLLAKDPPATSFAPLLNRRSPADQQGPDGGTRPVRAFFTSPSSAGPPDR
jgi:hypothetical protein